RPETVFLFIICFIICFVFVLGEIRLKLVVLFSGFVGGSNRLFQTLRRELLFRQSQTMIIRYRFLASQPVACIHILIILGLGFLNLLFRQIFFAVRENLFFQNLVNLIVGY